MPVEPSPTGAWLPLRRRSEGVAIRLFAFPYAGGDVAIFARWVDDLPREIELCPVQLPGRGRRLGERAHAEIGPLVRALADGLEPALEGRFAFFGHSLGALICFELARELRRRGRPLPFHLLVAARHAPQIPLRYAPLSGLPDGELLEALHQRYGYTRPEIDFEIDELLQLMLPTVRADVQLSERYVHAEEPPLPCPITAFGGMTDPTVTREELTAWRHQTAAGFDVRTLPGGHFFLESERTFLVRFVSGILLRAP